MISHNPSTWLSLRRNVRFGDTDAAGVMHFHQIFRWAHEAWEESLDKYGISPKEIFPSSKGKEEDPHISLPIVHCKANFIAPIYTGDQVIIDLLPKQLDKSTFEITTKFQREETIVAIALIRHLAINKDTRVRCNLPDKICLWLEASNICKGPKVL